ncbi:hypothetical protein [Paenibacillus sp. EKM211P]|uniref:hypothetical protein n=1 Tax=Paenibacillus sp. EKM211P TaxID=1683679 RepID=UPI0013E910BD|nr:hypothetical protein [Paenibacillus sp. EKM211P]KAF6583748.1 hypothetical protein G9G57_12225 [Paenibacillus sp. EKM211P]
MVKTVNNTPISILLSFLKSVKEYKKSKNGTIYLGEKGVTVKSAFCIILEIKENDLFGTLSGYLSLIDLVKKQVETNFKNKDRYITQLDEIQRAFIAVGLDNDITKFQHYITDVIINTLELCSDGLEEKEEIITVSKEQLEDIETQIADLSKQLEESALPKKLIAVLLHKLDDIEAAVQRYKRWGINEFEKVYDSLLGGLYKSRESIDLEKNKGVLQKIDTFMKTLLGFTSDGGEIVENAIEITEKVTDFLK